LKDSEIMEVLRKESEEFKKYEVGHRELDATLVELKKKKRPNPDEEFEIKKMQKRKLHYKDMMAMLVTQYKSQNKN
jgi:uncharacterized protein YdcH (DUF465 family)